MQFFLRFSILLLFFSLSPFFFLHFFDSDRRKDINIFLFRSTRRIARRVNFTFIHSFVRFTTIAFVFITFVQIQVWYRFIVVFTTLE